MNAAYVIKHLLGTFVFFSVIFISAGRIDYWQGMVYVSIGSIMVVLNYTLLRPDSDLLKERSAPGENVKKWDKTILGLSFLAGISMYVVAGLDSGRYHWSPEINKLLCVPGIIFSATGQLLFLIAQKQNKFFSSTVRIQTDRKHTVCNTGLYSFVRHPAYFGSLIQLIGFPLIFCSIWSIIPVMVSVVLLLVRTRLEDITLRNELTGYSAYSERTRYRIIPLIW